MKSTRLLLLWFFVLQGTCAFAQSQAFIFTVYGGLFLPSHLDFKETYQTTSDIIWGGGIALPMSSSLFGSGDISYFNTRGPIDPLTDSTQKIEQRFIHLGVINKQRLTGTFFIRLSGGLSYTTVKQKSSSARTPETTVEADKKLGYYGGIGIEQPLDPQGHLSIFADVVYDYRRSERKELYGDFGGLRVVFGIHLFLF